uniref:Heme chaperone HemW n=1 Tax=Eiseniibacteriota bacterium TaxID=2212470 RepID=A0A832I9G3_UNCEI
MEPPVPPGEVSIPEGPSAAARDAARAGVYVHVPFCAVRCSYCDFATGRLSTGGVARWLDALEREAALRAPEAAGTTFTSVFFGGGTPSALPPEAFRRAARAVRAHFAIDPGAEWTLEANPESVTPARLDAWRAAGANRLSIGMQSAHADELDRLGRAHAPGRPLVAAALARRAGFARLSLDLMFAFPGHDAARFRASVACALGSGAEHLSAYCFIPEAGTPLGNAVLRGEARVPAPETQADLYEALHGWLEAAGLACYETSNFCRPGAEARHNLVYWLRRPYVGLGPSAHGFLGGTRYENPWAFERWAAALERGTRPEARREPETPESAASETLMLGLRLAGGVRAADYAPAAWAAFEARYGAALARAEGARRVERTPWGWRLPRALRFVADDAVAWIEARAGRSLTVAPLGA